ncbi:DNA cytosine methyltransferase [Pseudomonas pergaminensis]|jgi:site-specific DNA-cytosine methylase|uniref:DNA cytosine methyltransferase n=1 Tax=Pseudomonas pergaminensis TaxID=2853159 RepID=A0ABW8QUZ5_9PSED
MQQPTIGNLFAGIEGFEVGFENAGGRTAWQVEWRRIKAKFWTTTKTPRQMPGRLLERYLREVIKAVS